MPNRPAPSKARLAIWIDKQLLDRYRAVVPRGEQQERIRHAIAEIVAEEKARESGRAEQAEEEKGVASNQDGDKETKTRVASNRRAR